MLFSVTWTALSIFGLVSTNFPRSSSKWRFFSSFKKWNPYALPISVVIREKVGNVFARHQQEGANQMNNTATGQEDERGTEGHSILKEQLSENNGHIIISLSSQPNQSNVTLHLFISYRYIHLIYENAPDIILTLTTRKTAEEESKAPLYRVMIVDRWALKRFPTCRASAHVVTWLGTANHHDLK